jgi:hypothetical protein
MLRNCFWHKYYEIKEQEKIQLSEKNTSSFVMRSGLYDGFFKLPGLTAGASSALLKLKNALQMVSVRIKLKYRNIYE